MSNIKVRDSAAVSSHHLILSYLSLHQTLKPTIMEELQPAANFDNTQHQRARESLYRAAATVQEMFYLFREKVVFKYPVHHIEHIGRELQIHAAKPGTPGTLSYKPKDGIVPLHEDIFSDPKDRHAVLSFMACQNPGAYLDDIILYFLKRENTTHHSIT